MRGPGRLPAHLRGHAGLHRRARRRHARRTLAVRAPAGVHAGPGRQGRSTCSTPGDIPVVATNRGGQVTYHGPGQVVAYPLVDLQRAGYFVKEYVYRLEEAVIRTLADFGVTGHRVAGAPGIYVRLDDPFSPLRALTGRRPDRGPFDGPGQDRRPGHQGQPPLHLPRRGAERGDGPGTLLAASTLAATPGWKPWTFLQSGSPPPGTRRRECWADKLARTSRPERASMSTNEVVREAQSVETYNAARQAEGRGASCRASR